MNELFYKVFHNKYLINEIFKHCKLFKIYKFQSFNDLNQLKRFEYLEYITILKYNGDEILTIDDLPKSGILKTLIFTNDNLCKILSSSIPFGVEKIVFPKENSKNTDIFKKLSLLPSSVKIIKNVYLNKHFKVQSTCTSNITSISFSSKFNETLKIGVIPSSVKTLKFLNWNNGGKKLNKNDLPNGIEKLDLGIYDRGLSIDILPNSITSLKMDHSDRFILEVGYIPNSVIKLEIYSYEKDGITIKDHSIPNSVKHLILNSTNTNLSMNSLPTSLTTLELGEYFDCKLFKGMLPKSLESITFSTDNTFIIEQGTLNINGLKRIECLTPFHEDIEFDEYLQGWSPILNEHYFPSTLLYLNFGCNFNNMIKEGDLPDSLETLIFGYKYNKPIQVPLPKNLTCLDFSNSKFNYSINSTFLPKNLKVLKLNSKFYRHSTNHLNKNLNIKFY